jgi:hypothetical protein
LADVNEAIRSTHNDGRDPMFPVKM